MEPEGQPLARMGDRETELGLSNQATTRVESLHTVLADDHDTIPPELDLPGYDLTFYYVQNVHVYPGHLDMDIFRVALSRVLRLYWHATGRVRKQEDNRWKITSTGLPIPLGICVQPQALDLDRVVIQDHLQPYLLEVTQSPYDDMDAPLLLIKVCLLHDCTTLGISWHHTLGDAAVQLGFTRALSAYYQGSPVPVNSIPSFTKPDFASLPTEHTQLPLSKMNHLGSASREAPEMSFQQDNFTQRVDVRVPISQLESLRQAVKLRCKSSLTISVQDCISAFVIHCLSSVLEQPIQEVTNVVSCRAQPPGLFDPHAVANAVVMVPCRLELEDLHDFPSLVLKIRESIVQGRDRAFVQSWMRAVDKMRSDAANNDGKQTISNELGTLLINSQLVLDWQSADFGFPGKSRFHTPGTMQYYLRVFWANNDLNDDVEASPPGRVVDISFGVPSHVKSAVEKKIGEILESDSFPHNLM